MKTIMKGASILTAILMVSMIFSPVFGAPVLPFERWGVAYDGGTPISTGLVTSWIDGVEYGSNTTSASGDVNIETSGDSTDSAGVKTGGYAGDSISYARDHLTGATGTFFTETDSWSVGGSNHADLNVGTILFCLFTNEGRELCRSK